MAKLNDIQKMTLDNLVLAFLDSLESTNTNCPTSDLLTEVSEKMHTKIVIQNLIGSFSRILCDGYRVESREGILFIKKNRAAIHHAKKERNFIYFYDSQDRKIDNFYLDFATGTFQHEPEDEILVENYHFASRLVPLLSKEWIFNYIDLTYTALINNYSDYDNSGFSDNCPKGFANYLKDKNYTTFRELKLLLEDFELESKYGTIYSSVCSYFWDKKVAKKIFRLGYAEVSKMLTNTIKNGDIFLNSLQTNGNGDRFEIKRFLDLALEYDFKIDTNRDFIHNSRNLCNIVNAEKNNKLSEKLKKLNFLNGLTVGDFTIVVPQTLSDLQNEGSQQHNCVGYFYNDSIIAGNNLIYFLRKTDNTNKSVITCRFNREQNETVEARRVNNSSLEKADKPIIHMIDTMIRTHLM